MDTTKMRGWALLPPARKFHAYDADGRSACGKYFAFAVSSRAFEPVHSTDLQLENDCAECSRRVRA